MNDLPTIDGANGATWVRLDKEWADVKVMVDGATRGSKRFLRFPDTRTSFCYVIWRGSSLGVTL
jgi:hypothetical protein